MIERTYTQARENLAKLMDSVTDDREAVVIKRRGHEDVVMISADELAGIMETAHLLRSPANAQRLIAALERARAQSEAPQSIASLAKEVGLDDAVA